MSFLTRAAVILPALFSYLGHAVNPVEVRGRDFIDIVTGERLMIIGVDYQPGGQGAYQPSNKEDALTNSDFCLRDAVLMQRLGVNTLRVYNLDPTLDHSECASIFNAAGIYMMLDVNSPLPGESINRAEPWTSYNSGYLNRAFGIIENFKNFPNTLGFFSANEVMNDLSTAEFNPQYIRAVQRDMKNYIKNHVNRTIPVGYSAADVREILQDTWAYMQCVHDEDESSSDFFGLNSYSWCNGDNIQTSGYETLANMFANSAIPVFFSEYGCNRVTPREFEEVQALYGDQMRALSGGLVYEYSAEEAGYGLVEIEQDGSIRLMQDFDNLQRQFNKLNIQALESASPQSTNVQAPECSDNLITANEFSKNFTIPAVCPGCQDLINNGIKNPQNGKLVNVEETNVQQKVYGSGGQQVQNLKLNIVSDGANTPNGENTSPSSTGGDNTNQPSQTGNEARPTETGTGVVVHPRGSSMLALVSFVVCALCL
ncbi:hypothetical protein GGP41_001080 [Bipolaris sorokiniana]|uniref:1,3-beta-glucanosyltransferase n=1 Tax=Cochliobolus sativus TaxID=45130 RepID=A0A8H5Z8X8_COCSA|nr:hypothetical protein GGP41_001080 [Bipolaris sorokiniana]